VAEPCLGAVASLRRYPVKSMLGEELQACEVSERGVAGDRVMALVHRESGKVASAKNPRQWRALLRLQAVLADPTVKITFPDGNVMPGTDPEIDATLSEFLEQPVALTAVPPAGAELDRADPDEVLRDGIRARVQVVTGQIGGAAPKGTFFDFATLHLITTATVDRIAALSPRGAVEVDRYRPNIVIGTSAQGFPENDWVDRDLRIGPDLMIRVIARTPRCAIPTLEHGDLPRDVDALRVPAAHNRVKPAGEWGAQPCAGVYAQVLRPGRVESGDTARLA
jgi:uncharacterized protein